MKDKVTTLLFAFILIIGISSCSDNPKTIKKNARITVITPECIRMEYSENGKFVNEPSLFAYNRKSKCNEFTYTDQDGLFIFETSRLKLIYKPDGKTFSDENIRIIIKKDNSPIRWVPGMKNKQNLGGTLRTVDGVSGKIDLGEGVLSRDGWYLHDDSKRPLLSGNWVKSRPEGSGIDWYFFGYGSD